MQFLNLELHLNRLPLNSYWKSLVQTYRKLINCPVIESFSNLGNQMFFHRWKRFHSYLNWFLEDSLHQKMYFYWLISIDCNLLSMFSTISCPWMRNHLLWLLHCLRNWFCALFSIWKMFPKLLNFHLVTNIHNPTTIPSVFLH